MIDAIKDIFDYTHDAIGEEEIARVALEYWLEVDKYGKLPMTESWHFPMLAFQLGYLFAKERYNIND